MITRCVPAGKSPYLDKQVGDQRGQPAVARTGLTVLLPLVLRLSFNFTQPACRGFGSATHAVPLPDAKPRTVREHFIVPSICSRDVAWAEWPYIRRFEHFL